MAIKKGHLYNYPLYPAFIYSAYAVQGNTVDRNTKVNVVVEKMCYHSLYVAISRVQDPEQIAHILVPFQMDYITLHLTF